jgi:ketosteroid isomerase-like protein
MDTCAVCGWGIEGAGIETSREGRSTRVCSPECASAEVADRARRDREAIRAHIDGLFRAYIRKDREAIRRGHTPDWRGFQVGSAGIVRGIDDYMRVADEILGRATFTRYEIVDVDIQLFGDAAVVYYVARDWLRGPDGTEQPAMLRSVDLYRREADGWNQCGSNICALPAAS